MEKLRYYLGANSPTGFYGYFQQAYGPDWRVWLIKGGPGSGKSTLMKRVAEAAGGEWEYVHCSSDPKSLDAILQPEKKLMVADATAPHTMDALWPGCVEQILNLGEGFDIDALRQSADEVVRLNAENAALHKRAVHWLAAAAQAQTARQQAETATLRPAWLHDQAADWVRANFPPTDRAGSQRRRGLCAVTPDGILFYHETVTAQADRIYLLQDDRGAAAPLLLAELRDRLLENGYDLTACYCSLFPAEKLEHLLLPHQRVAFVTVNSAHPFPAGPGCIPVPLDDVYGAGAPDPERLAQQLALESGLLQQAVDCMRQARQVHDLLEQHYIHAMDFAFAEKKAAQLGEVLRAAMA